MRHHRLTLIVMLLVAGTFLCLNLMAWRYHLTVPTLTQLGPNWYGYGWPAPMARQAEPDLLAALTRDLRSLPFLINLGFALFMTVGSGWICESWLELKLAMGSCRAESPAAPQK